MRRSVPYNSRLRRGFTMVELLVVIGLIGFLLSAIAVATFRMIGSARTAATKATLLKVQNQLKSRMEAVNRLVDQLAAQNFQSQVFVEAVPVAQAANLSTYPSRIPQITKALARKSITRQFLPQNWTEARYIANRAGKSVPTTLSQINATTESAEVLYLLLTDSSVVGYTPEPDLFKGAEVRDTDGNGFMELVDAWGQPLRFIRWPTRMIRPGGFGSALAIGTGSNAEVLIGGIPSSLTTSTNQDPDDPLNVLSNPTMGTSWTSAVSPASVESTGIAAADLLPLHTLNTWHTPLVISAGEDGLFGLELPLRSDPTIPIDLRAPYQNLNWLGVYNSNPAELRDNITNLNIKAGGN